MANNEYLPGIPGSTEVGWVPPEDGFTRDDLEGWLKSLQGKMESIWWNLGDMMNVGHVTAEDEVYQMYLYHYEPQTIARVRNICAAFPIDKRRAPAVSIWKHELLTPKHVPEEWREEILDQAADIEEGGMTFKDIRGKLEDLEHEPHGNPERIDHGPFKSAPECPTCGAESQHWHRPPAEFSKRQGVSGGHLKAV